MDAVLQLPRTHFAPGAVGRLPAELHALGVVRPLVISDRGLLDAGVLGQVTQHLAQRAAVFDRVTPNPLFADVDAACSLYRNEACDGVVAVGGGSVLDVAKYVALLATHDGTVRDFVGRPEPFCRPGAPLVAVPTTAGTGSEASPDAGVHADAESASVGISSRWATPQVALLDPQLTSTLPRRLTAATGIDALSHCIEGFLSRTDSPVADALALDGIRRVRTHLPRAVAQGTDLAARSEMLVAGYVGGVAIGMGLGPGHAIAIPCGDQGLHHGVLSGIGIVATLDAVLEHVTDKGLLLRRALDVPEGGSASVAVAALMRALGLPATLAEAGYRIRDLSALAQACHDCVFNLAARWHPTAADYRRLLEASSQDRLPCAD